MGLERIDQPFLVRHDRKKLQHEILRMQLGSKAILYRFRLTCRNCDVVPCSRKVPHNPLLSFETRLCVKTAPHKRDANVVGLVVGKGEQGLRRLAVDELDTEDFGLGKGGRDLNLEVGGLFREVDAFGVFI